MRNEQEIFDLILSYARQDENIRVVVLNGSRANPAIRKDLFQDYDIVYFVEDMQPLIRNRDLVAYFGELMILQLPDDMGTGLLPGSNRYGYLMQFTDGNRIDLSICALDSLETAIIKDSLTKVLLDKDGRVQDLADASDLDYRPKRPTRKMFEECCNEFWWVTPYVAKGLWRQELLYARYMLDCLLRGELMKMLEWYFGIQTGFSRSMGKQGKFLKEVLESSDWMMLEATFPDSTFENIWEALFVMGSLFRKIAVDVGDHFGFVYPFQEDRGVTEFLYRVRALPEDAVSFDQSLYRPYRTA